MLALATILALTPAFAQSEEPAPQPTLPDLTLVPLWAQDLPPEPAPAVDPGAPQPSFATVNVPGLPLDLKIQNPEPGFNPRWKWTVNDSTSEVRLGMRASEAYTNVRFRATNFQPDITLLQGERLTEELDIKDDEQAELDLTLGEWTLLESEVLGPVQSLNFHAWDGFLERDLYYNVLVFAVRDHAVIVEIESSDTLERTHEIAGELMEMLQIAEPPFDPAELGLVGTVNADAGYSLVLPEGLRMLSEKESGLVSGGRLTGEGPYGGEHARLNVIYMDRLYDNHAFKCRAEAGIPLEILDPKKSQPSGPNFRAWAVPFMGAGSAKIVSGGEEMTYDFSDDFDRSFHTTDSSDPEFVHLQDRDAYIWRVSGQVYSEPRDAVLFYTAYADVGLTCLAVAQGQDEQSGELLQAFEQSVKGIQIAGDDSGEPYPMPLSLQARYTSWWPTGNPLLQLYWLPLPLMLIAGYLVMKD